MAQTGRAGSLVLVFCFCAFAPTMRAGPVPDAQGSTAGLTADQRPGIALFSGTGGRQLYMLNISAGPAAYLQGRHDLIGTPGLGLSLSYIHDRQFFGVRAASAAFIGGGGNDISLLYGRAWVSEHSLLSIASGLGSSGFDSDSESFRRIGLPLDIRALLLSGGSGGASLGVHGFAFFTTSYLYFGICLNLGIFASSG